MLRPWLVLAILGAVNCGGQPDSVGWGTQTNVEAVFASNCTGCHASEWESCWNVQSASSGVEGMISTGSMPPGGGLSSTDRATVLAWLDAGAPCVGPPPQ